MTRKTALTIMPKRSAKILFKIFYIICIISCILGLVSLILWDKAIDPTTQVIMQNCSGIFCTSAFVSSILFIIFDKKRS